MASPNTAARLYQYDPAIHGGAKFADRRHLTERGYCDEGILLGYGLPEHTRAGSYPITLSDEIHDLICGSTRSGKGIGGVAMRCIEHDGMIIVFDNKGRQNSEIAIKARLAMGRKVVVMGDPELAKGLGIDCAGFDLVGTLNPDSDTFFDDAYTDADAIVIDKDVKDPFWPNEGKAMLAGLSMHARVCPKALLPVPEKGKTLAQVRAMLNLSKSAFREMVAGKWLEEDGKDPVLLKPGMVHSRNDNVRNAASRILGKNPKELASILSTTQSNTHWLESKTYERMVSTPDIDLAEVLASGDTDLFIVTSPRKIALARRPMRLLLSKIIQIVTGFETRPKRPIRLVLEEFCTVIGYLELVEDAFGLVAGEGLIITAVIQSLAQLRRKYPDSFEDIIANSQLQVIAARDNFTCEYLSKLCGTTTVEQLTEESAAIRSGLLGDPQYTSVQDRLESRPLISPAEIRGKHPTLQLLILQGADPALAYISAYFVDARFRDRKAEPLFGIDSDYADRPLPKPIDLTRKGLDIGKALEPYFVKRKKRR